MRFSKCRTQITWRWSMIVWLSHAGCVHVKCCAGACLEVPNWDFIGSGLGKSLPKPSGRSSSSATRHEGPSGRLELNKLELSYQKIAKIRGRCVFIFISHWVTSSKKSLLFWISIGFKFLSKQTRTKILPLILWCPIKRRFFHQI